MKKILVGFLGCWLAVAAVAADANWLTDLDKALAKARTEKKPVLIDFTGSDWCPPCKALHSQVLTSPDFVDYANKNLVLVELDFPRRKQQTEELKQKNQQLAAKYRIEGYPTLVLLSSESKELGRKTGYGGEKPKDVIADIEKWNKK